ncbi:MAG: hypothetical protein WEE64_00440 [Dehalococcoidia bacterium]
MAERFRIRIDPFWRPFLLIGGARSESSYVEVEEDSISIRSGWLFNQTIPRDEIEGAAPTEWPWWASSWRTNFSGTIGLVGSYNGVVEILFRERRRLWGFTGYRRLAVSLEEPERFIEALGVPLSAA